MWLGCSQGGEVHESADRGWGAQEREWNASASGGQGAEARRGVHESAAEGGRE